MRGATGEHRLPPMLIERRTEPRQVVELAVRLADGARALTRDVSPSGLFVETDRASHLHELVELRIALDTGWGEFAFQARAEVVRLEAGALGPGIGVRFVNSQLAPLEESRALRLDRLDPMVRRPGNQRHQTH
jgi:hypothetical protein